MFGAETGLIAPGAVKCAKSAVLVRSLVKKSDKCLLPILQRRPNNERNEFESPTYGKLTSRRRGGRLRHDGGTRAELKECIERTKQMHTDIEKVHKEMWSAVKDRNEDAFAALSQEFERSPRILAEEWAQTSALAKIAVISEEG